jgi:hypothetical protein
VFLLHFSEPCCLMLRFHLEITANLDTVASQLPGRILS